MVVYLERARLRAELLREFDRETIDPDTARILATGVAGTVERYEPALAEFARLPPKTPPTPVHISSRAEHALHALDALPERGLSRYSAAGAKRLPMMRGSRFRGYLHHLVAAQLADDARGINAEYRFGARPQMLLLADSIATSVVLVIAQNDAWQVPDGHEKFVKPTLRAIAFHETAHRVQDRGVPWLGVSFAHAARVADSPVTTDEELPPGGNYRHAQDYLLGLQCLLEGHAEWVGKGLAARSHPDTVGFFLTDTVGGARNTGDAQLNRYGHGLRFVENVVAQVGVDGLNEVWRGPGNVPSMDEVHHPRRWLDRVNPKPGR